MASVITNRCRSNSTLSQVSLRLQSVTRSFSSSISSSHDAPSASPNSTTFSLPTVFSTKHKQRSVLKKKRPPGGRPSVAGQPTADDDPSSSLSSTPPSTSDNNSRLSEDKGGEDDDSFQEQVGDEETDFFCEKDLRVLDGMKFHPYPDEAPYMQAYESVPLTNDSYTDTLLHQLNPTRSPVFKTITIPPRTVLDLGCGEGDWILEAAATWGYDDGTLFIGFDLVDVFIEYTQRERLGFDNVKFVQGNFVKDELPFADEFFDLVRMANLSLCIPYDRWEFVLKEVHRVLAPSGRLELIDDEIFFPYGVPPLPPTDPRCSSSLDLFDDGSFSGSDDDEGIDVDAPLLDKSLGDDWPEMPPLHPSEEWARLANASRALEDMFFRALARSGIHPRPSLFIQDMLRGVFGKRWVKKVDTIHLSLPPPFNPDGGKVLKRTSTRSSDSGFGSASNTPAKKPWITIEWDTKDKKDKTEDKCKGTKDDGSTSTSLRSFFENFGFKDGGSTKATGYAIPSSRFQHEGLLLWPDVFIPFSPSVLEMHACKHMHVLLSCKPALREVIAELKDERGQQLVGDEDFKDWLWDYECFRRTRFNWPSTPPELRMEESPRIKQRSIPDFTLVNLGPNSGSSNDLVYRPEEVIPVRTIRVFQAYKKDPNRSRASTSRTRMWRLS